MGSSIKKTAVQHFFEQWTSRLSPRSQRKPLHEAHVAVQVEGTRIHQRGIVINTDVVGKQASSEGSGPQTRMADHRWANAAMQRCWRHGMRAQTAPRLHRSPISMPRTHNSQRLEVASSGYVRALARRVLPVPTGPQPWRHLPPPFRPAPSQQPQTIMGPCGKNVIENWFWNCGRNKLLFSLWAGFLWLWAQTVHGGHGGKMFRNHGGHVKVL